MEENIVGKRFGRLLVLEEAGKNKYNNVLVRCICDCGNKKVVRFLDLKSNHTKSCGCYSKEMASKKFSTHGLRHTQLYKVWAGIKDRTNPNNHNCKDNYRKLSVQMCEEWRNDFMAFYNWAIENGYKEEKLPNGKNKWTIDRIDTKGDYEPRNCRWVTNKEQMNNQTTNRIIEYKGKIQTLAQWCDELNLPYGTTLFRLHIGYDVERAFTESTDKQNYYEYKGELLNINQIVERTGLTRTNVWNRITRGWTIERIMEQPARKINKKG